MDHPPDRRLTDLVRRAAGLDADQREALLARECAGDEDLRARVIEALSRQEFATVHGPTPGPGAPTEASWPRAEPARVQSGKRLGGFRLIEVLGEGGMGTVYLAEQDRPRRQVALKVVRAGVMSARLLRRFELESQVLARLQHPGIAQIYEASTAQTDEGAQPFFAMELVRGVALNDHARALPVALRLDLFVRVCDAVQHAHAKGVIHRDLKPANILVGADGQPKILDFGVARATDADVNAATMQTEYAQLVGTVPYMSPEQIAGDAGELDTRSDVYTLGVILYELLAGTLPHRVLNKSIAEAARVIGTEEPAPLSNSDRALRGDLETIVGKALEKDRARRYQSASELGEDVRRFLRNEPVTARPPSAAYQMRKFAARNKGLVAGLSAALGVLVLGIVGTSIGLAASVRAEAEADREARTVKGINDFLINKLLLAARPEEAQGRKITVDEVLGKAAGEVERSFPDQPAVRASLHQTIGRAYVALGDLSQGEAHLSTALALRRGSLGALHEDTVTSIHDLASLRFAQSRWADAEGLFHQAAAGFRALNPDDPRLTQLLSDEAATISNLGRRAEAEALLRKALALSERRLGADAQDTLAIANNLGFTLQDEGKTQEALPLYRRVVDTRTRVLGVSHPSTLVAMNNLSTALWDTGDLKGAEEIQSKVLEARRRVSGPLHPDTILAMSNVAFFREKMGRLEDALALFEEALAAETEATATGRGDRQQLAILHDNISSVLQALDRTEEAESHIRTGLDILTKELGPDNPETLSSANSLGALLVRRGLLDEGAPILERTLATRERVLGPDHPDTLGSRHNLALLRLAQGKLDEAEGLCLAVLADRIRVRGPNHPATLLTRHTLAEILSKRGKDAEALAIGEECLTLREKALGPTDAATLATARLVADMYDRAHRKADAAALRDKFKLK